MANRQAAGVRGSESAGVVAGRRGGAFHWAQARLVVQHFARASVPGGASDASDVRLPVCAGIGLGRELRNEHVEP